LPISPSIGWIRSSSAADLLAGWVHDPDEFRPLPRKYSQAPRNGVAFVGEESVCVGRA
jgi:hypothetical protein